MTEMSPGDREYRDQGITLSSLFVTSDVVTQQRFTNCFISGPAVMLLLGESVMSGCTFDGELSAVLWPIPDDREHLIGAVGFVSCEFYNCRFQRVGLGVPESKMEEFKQGFGLT